MAQTYTFDDGSTITDEAVAGGWVTTSTPATDNGIAGWSQDRREAEKLNIFYPQNGVSWWENLAAYGATRAIDSHFGQATVDKTSNPAYFAGQNGRTYSTAGGMPALSGTGGLLLLGLAAAAALILLNK